jgi:sugar-specific transcriptional regulator TrmB
MKEILKDAGLTKNETLVYLTLLKLSKAKASEIIKDAKISSGKIYETLDKLIEKGLVKIVIENGVKTFIANNPKTILTYLKEKEKKLQEQEKQLEKIIPNLQDLMKLKKETETVSLIKGYRGVSSIVYEALKTGKEIKIMGVTSSKSIKFNNFWKNWHRKRISLKKECKILFSDYKTEYWKFFKKLKHTEVKESLTITPSAILMIDNNTFIFTYKKELTCIQILSKDISESFHSMFDSLWKIGKKHIL